jgi:glycosyltransferase involved in cell wall biosynthesis
MPTRPERISFFSSDLSDNNVVRLYPIVKVLSRRYEVEVIGPLFGDQELFSPYTTEFEYRTVRAPAAHRMCLTFWKRLWRELAGVASGEVIYAFKPMLASYGAAVFAGWRGRRPVVLDIEDFDACSFHSLDLRSRWNPRMVREPFRDQGNPYSLRLAELLMVLTKHRVVASAFLQHRYGGVRIVQGANCHDFDPARVDRAAVRTELGLLDGEKVILFAGALGPHKGVPDLVQATRATGRADLRLLLVGPRSDDAQRLAREASDVLRVLGPMPHAEMPRLLAAADLVCLPQRDDPYARAQIPAKVFEAMAMQKAIIATSMSDLPEILAGCGVIVPPGDVSALAAALAGLASDPDRCARLGAEARERCVRFYSWDAMEEPLDSVIRRAARARRRLPWRHH